MTMSSTQRTSCLAWRLSASATRRRTYPSPRFVLDAKGTLASHGGDEAKEVVAAVSHENGSYFAIPRARALADDRTTRTWPGYSISSSICLAMSWARTVASASEIILGLDHDADLAAGLDGVGALDALVGVGDLLELLEALDVVRRRVSLRAPGRAAETASAAWTSTSRTVFGLDVVVVCLDGVDDLGALAEAAGKIGADDGVTALDLVVDCLAKVVQKAGSLGGNRVEPELGGHDAGESTQPRESGCSTFWPYEVR